MTEDQKDDLLLWKFLGYNPTGKVCQKKKDAYYRMVNRRYRKNTMKQIIIEDEEQFLKLIQK